MIETDELFNIKEASEWATVRLGKTVTVSNISYLIQYGLIAKIGENGTTKVSRRELTDYYKSYNGNRELSWSDQLGGELNWALSFDKYTEAETTKHVHRLHPYKGKFIPQLVEYFLDSHTDAFKKEAVFKRGDIVLDPFCGSGTTLVQACELGLHAIGIDVSAFNSLIANCKSTRYDIKGVQAEINRITAAFKGFLSNSHTLDFDERLTQALCEFNNRYFPVPEYKYRVRRAEIDQDRYGAEKEEEFLPIFHRLVGDYNIKLRQDKTETFLDRWYLQHVRDEIRFVSDEIKKIKSPIIKDIVSVIMSRTIRSCRSTTHADLATLIEPITATYYCAKHGKICKPLFSILKWWQTYTRDTINRLSQFDRLRTDTSQVCLTGDSRTMDILGALREKDPAFSELADRQGIRGIFSSPPYVGLIDYHEQHAYAYDLFGLERKDNLEIGPLFKGQDRQARQDYIQAITDVLNNCKRFLSEDYYIFLVANDKYNMYPTISEGAAMQIVNRYKRPVLNRTEKNKGAYSETIFHLKNRG
ncbi:MAG: site-specific DNA-methyltransferase [Nitrospirae bacterium]|nr:site-specific DNA-methyltransferase [Nitrospirota bacterium]